MTIKERLRNPFVQQYLLEILLPIIGYYFFEWSLVIIAVFYIIDQLGSEYSFVRKLRAIRGAENKSTLVFSAIAISFFLIVICVEVFTLFWFFTKLSIDAQQKLFTEFTVFAQEELWILVPLIILMYHFKDQFTFFMPRRYLQKVSERFFYGHLIEGALIAILVVVGCLVFAYTTAPDQVLLFVFLAAKLMFDFSVGKWIEKKSDR